MLLLFMIGLEIDLKKIVKRGARHHADGGGADSGVLWAGDGLLRGSWARDGLARGLYLGVAIALSSTVIIVKILHDKRVGAWAGRLTLGVLVLQDLFAILFLAIQPDLKHPHPCAGGPFVWPGWVVDGGRVPGQPARPARGVPVCGVVAELVLGLRSIDNLNKSCINHIVDFSPFFKLLNRI